MRVVEEDEDPSRTSVVFNPLNNYASMPEITSGSGDDTMRTSRLPTSMSDDRPPSIEWEDGKARRPSPTRWKIPTTILLWVVVCFSMSLMPYPLNAFSDAKVNALFKKYLPKMNRMVRKKLPASLGSCDQSTYVPTPCQEQGKLYKNCGRWEKDSDILDYWFEHVDDH